MPDKFRVDVGRPWKDQWPKYFDNFYTHCRDVAVEGKYHVDTVANYELRSIGGRLIKTSTQGWYLRWDNEASHTAFVLRWS